MTAMTPLLTLAQIQITAPVSTLVGASALTGLQGMAGLSVFVRFAGAGGTSVDAYIQSLLDGAASWYDIANVHFTAAGVALLSFAQGAVNGALTFDDGSIASNTVLNSGVVPLGDQLRIKYGSSGTWTAGLLSAFAMPRG